MEKITINLANLISSTMAIRQEDGEKVYSAIVKNLELGKKVELDFSGLEIIVSVFLNNAIGKLYGTKYNKVFEDGLLSVVNISVQDFQTLEIVKRRAIEFFQNKGK